MASAPLSLIVILRPAHGRLRDADPVSQKNLAAILPPPHAVERAQAYFSAQGCTVYPAVANSFAIEAERTVLDKIFRLAELKSLESTGGDLDLGKLPRDIQELLEAVSFTRPPDFGPNEFV